MSKRRHLKLPVAMCDTHAPQANVQDEEDAKKGMYNWFAQCQKLLTRTRLALASVFTAAIALALVDFGTAVGLLLLCVIIFAAAAQYSHAIIGGVVGDFLGASIATAEILIYLFLLVDWQVCFSLFSQLSLQHDLAIALVTR